MKKLVPKDPDAAKKVRECEKAITKIKFEEAIATEEEQKHSVTESLDFHSIGAYAFLEIILVKFASYQELLFFLGNYWLFTA